MRQCYGLCIVKVFNKVVSKPHLDLEPWGSVGGGEAKCHRSGGRRDLWDLYDSERTESQSFALLSVEMPPVWQ